MRCLFPQRKDVGHDRFRKNLIRVPSCYKHNSEKSDDDEFLLLVLPGLIGNNKVGYQLWESKVNRALRRKHDGFFYSQIISNPNHVITKRTDGRLQPVAFGNPKFHRLQKCFQHMARGLYFHEFGKSFDGEVHAMFGFMNYYDKNLTSRMQAGKDCFGKINGTRGVKGANPEVFIYEFENLNEIGFLGLRMVFYGASEVFVGFKQTKANASGHYGLLNALIESSDKVIVSARGKQYHFGGQAKKT